VKYWNTILGFILLLAILGCIVQILLYATGRG